MEVCMYEANQADRRTKRDYEGLGRRWLWLLDTYEDRGSFITSEMSLRRISVSRTASVRVLKTVLCTL